MITRISVKPYYLRAIHFSVNVYLDAKTGRQIWKKSYPLEKRTGKHPAIADSLLVFSGRDSCLYGVSAFTGKELWAKKMASHTAGNPIIYNGRIYYVIGGTLYAFE